MDPDRELSLLKEVIEKQIGALFAAREPRSLYEPMAWVMNAGGKRLRPVLMILSCRSVGGRLEDCLEAALAVEILHAFTLVHDDIMDNDDTRRGVPAVHKKWDDATAILAGDGLVTRAYQVLLGCRGEVREVLQIFTDGLMDLCEGQALDKDFEKQAVVSMPAYREMIRKKTARLIEVSCEIGAVLGGAGPAERQILKNFAADLGEAFQIQDDLLDIISAEDVTGKPRCSDIMESKKTFLSIHFLQNADETQRSGFLRLFGKEDLTSEEAEYILDCFARTGSVEAARREVDFLVKRAIEHIRSLSLASQSRDLLVCLADKLRERVS